MRACFGSKLGVGGGGCVCAVPAVLLEDELLDVNSDVVAGTFLLPQNFEPVSDVAHHERLLEKLTMAIGLTSLQAPGSLFAQIWQGNVAVGP